MQSNSGRKPIKHWEKKKHSDKVSPSSRTTLYLENLWHDLNLNDPRRPSFSLVDFEQFCKKNGQ